MKKIILLFVGIMLICTISGFAQGTTMTLGTVTAAAGDTVSIPINVANFNNVGAISLKISYNTSSLTFVGTANSPVTFTNNASGGVVTLGWFDATATSPVNIASGKLVDLKFVFNGTTSSLTFNTAQCEISNESATVIPVTYTNGTVNSSSSISLSLANVTATPGSNVSVALKTQHFNNIGAISLKISYDTTKLAFTGIANPLSGVTFTSSASNGIVSLGWFDQTGTHPISVDTLSKLLDIQFTYKGGTSTLSFTAQCDISNSSGVSLTNVIYAGGQVSATPGTTPTLQLGTVAGQTNLTVPLTVQAFNSIGAISLKIQYNAAALNFTGVANAPTGLTASASAGVITISWFDQTGTNPLNISSGKLLDLNFTYNGGTSNLTFNNSQCDLANSTGTSLVGVVYNNGSVTGATPPTLTISNVSGGTVGGSIGVPIKVQSLKNVGAISLKINYDPTVLTFTGVTNTPTGVTFTNNAAGGVITLGWFDQTGTTPINLDSNAVLLQLNFTFNGGSSTLTFNTSQCDIANSSGTSLNNVVYVNGGVAAIQPTIKISSVLAKTGDSVNVPVTVQSFKNVGAISLKIAYNSTALTFKGIANSSITGVTSNASGGVITIGWFDATGNTPVNIDSAKLLDLAFTYNGGSSSLAFNTSQCDIANSSGVSLNNVAYTNGGVNPLPGTAPTLSLPNLMAVANANLSVPMKAYVLHGIGAVSVKIQYNAAALNFTGITNNLTGVTFSSSTSNGVLTLSWFDATGHSPINIDSAAIVNLNFTYLGGTSSLSFLSAQSEISDSAGNVITGITYVNGSVSVLTNQPPVFTQVLPDTTIKEMQTLSFTYKATDINGDSLTFAVAKGATGLSIGAKTGILTWTPSYTQAGKYVIVVSVSDGAFTVKDTANVTVLNVNRKPYFTSFLQNINLNGLDTLIFKYAAADSDGQLLKYILINPPANTIINPNTGLMRFLAPKDTSTFSITVGVTDGIDTTRTTARVSVITGIKRIDGLPTDYTLSQNYPNPFNPSTNIEFTLPKISKVVLKIYNVLGQEVATLVNQELSAGKYNYEFNAANLSSGMYIYRLQAGDNVFMKKMTLLK